MRFYLIEDISFVALNFRTLKHPLSPKYFFFIALIIVHIGHAMAQEKMDSLVSLDLDEITVFQPYQFANVREETSYNQLEEDLRVIYPLLKIVRSEYERINSELAAFYGEKQQEEFLKWYETYAKESYMHHLSVLNVRQGRLFLKMVTRELDETPYQLLKKYRNGFRAVLWQGAAHVFFANLKSDYKPEDNPMIEHIMLRLNSEYEVTGQ